MKCFFLTCVIYSVHRFQLSKRSFPMCMQNLHQGLRSNHHLKHWGRMQYGLFLKGIGLSLEEALKFWRMEFTKTMEPDKVQYIVSNNANGVLIT